MRICLPMALVWVLWGCAALPAHVTANERDAFRAPSGPARLDDALQEGARYLADKIPPRTKIGVVNMHAPSRALADYVIDSLVMHLVNTDAFTVVERSELDALQKEQKYQLSGEVSDGTVLSIGQRIGTRVIITGAIIPLGGEYSLRLKITDVETARIIGTGIYPVMADGALLSLLTPPVETPAAPAPHKPPAPPVIHGDLNIITNNTTTVNGDVYINKPAWFDAGAWRR